MPLLASAKKWFRDCFARKRRPYRKAEHLRFKPGFERLDDRVMPAVIPTLFNTGVDDSGNVLADGSVDPHYTITSAPSPNIPGPANVVEENGFPFDYWVANGTSSKWIAPHANENDFNGGVSEPPGTFTYLTTFNLQGFDPSTAAITGQYSADNTLVQVLLNGADARIPAGTSTDFFAFHSFVIGGGFVPGVNTLEFVVSNAVQTDWPDNLHNPSGLRVEMTGTAATESSVTATLTADNHYGLYVGSADGSALDFIGRNEVGFNGSPGAYNWSLPETWTFEPGVGDRIYVLAWDDGGPQSWIGQFDLPGGVTLYSGMDNWEFSVGSGSNPGETGAVPPLSQVMGDIACATWAPVGASAANGSSPWGTIPDLPLQASFIWHDTLGSNSGSDGHYVIYRTKAPVTGNSPPVAGNDNIMGGFNAPLTIPAATLLLNDSDADNDPLLIVSVTSSSDQGGTVTLNDNGTPSDGSDDFVVYTPPANYSGPVTFQYTIHDSFGWEASATVTILARAVTATLTADNHYGLYVGKADGGNLALIGRNEVGFNGNPGPYNWSLPETHNFGMAAGEHIYVLAWDDGGPQSWIGQFTLPDGTVLYSDTVSWQYVIGSGANPGEAGSVPPLSQVMGDIAAATWAPLAASAANGSSPWGTIPGLSSAANFVWHDTLGESSSSDGHYVIFRTDAPVIEPPIAVDNDFVTFEGEPLTVDGFGVLGNDLTPFNETLNAILVSPTTHGSIDLHSDGTFTYTPDPEFVGTDSFTYR